MNAKIASGLSEKMHGEFQAEVAVVEQSLAKKGKMLNGRQLAWMIYNYFKITATVGKY